MAVCKYPHFPLNSYGTDCLLFPYIWIASLRVFMDTLSYLDLLVTPFYLIIIYFISRSVLKGKIENNPEYSLYLPSLTAKLLGALSLCFVYALYYRGGDTTQYFSDSISVNKLFFNDPKKGMDVIINGITVEKLSYFSDETGYPVYFRDPSTSFVVQVVSVFTFFGFLTYMPTSLLVAWFSFLGIWNLFKVFKYEFPTLSKQMAISIFFIPSVLFWGSGILKDTFTLSALGYFIYAFHTGLIRGKGIIKQIIVMTISIMIIIKIKPYIFIALIPGSMIWLTSSLLGRIHGQFIRYAFAPAFILFFLGGAISIIIYMGNSLGKFSADQLLDRVVITQRDLKSSYYMGNTFDIGDFDASFTSILSVSHKAIFAGLFRPMIFEARNFLMLISGLENTFFLILFLLVLIKTRVIRFFLYFFKHHLLTFSLIFSLFFGFSVGLSTSNFGSLVRYKIPAVPLFSASMFIILYFERIRSQERNKLMAEAQTSAFSVQS